MSEFEDLYGEWLVDVQVKTMQKGTPKGPRLMDPRTATIYVEPDTSVVTDTNGESASANHRLVVPQELLDMFTGESEVLIDGRWGRVLQMSKFITVGFPAHGVVYVR